ncbi:MAG: hypothetical protein AAFU67_08270, partial [Bacteroidota bacterium]
MLRAQIAVDSYDYQRAIAFIDAALPYYEQGGYWPAVIRAQFLLGQYGYAANNERAYKDFLVADSLAAIHLTCPDPLVIELKQQLGRLLQIKYASHTDALVAFQNAKEQA